LATALDPTRRLAPSQRRPKGISTRSDDFSDVDVRSVCIGRDRVSPRRPREEAMRREDIPGPAREAARAEIPLAGEPRASTSNVLEFPFSSEGEHGRTGLAAVAGSIAMSSSDDRPAAGAREAAVRWAQEKPEPPVSAGREQDRCC
jgi:hypothetical protein